jgi:Oligosaccharyltransferase subunit Ribophorin II
MAPARAHRFAASLLAAGNSCSVHSRVEPTLRRCASSAQGGAFSVRLIVGDVGMAAPVDWELGTAEVTHARHSDGSRPTAPEGPLSSFVPKPVITHIHRCWAVLRGFVDEPQSKPAVSGSSTEVHQ